MRFLHFLFLSSSYRDWWWPWLKWLIVFAVVITPIFWLTDLDIIITGWFFDEADQAFNIGLQPFWQFVYHLAPYLTGLLLFGSMIAIAVAPWMKRLPHLRLYGIFMLLSLVIGPGLVVNSLFKDHWERPRPVDTTSFSGAHQYIPPLAMGDNTGGKSFPSGHASSGFVLIAFFFLLWRHQRRSACIAFASSLFIGGLLGLARIIQGGHYLSDVLWAAILVFFVTGVLYFWLLNIPAREDLAEKSSAQTKAPFWLLLLLPLAVIFTVLPVIPFEGHDSTMLNGKGLPPSVHTLRLDLDAGNLQLETLRANQPLIGVDVHSKGYAFPGAKVETRCRLKTPSEAHCQIRHRGWFTENRSRVRLRLSGNRIAHIIIQRDDDQTRLSLPLTYPLD